MGGSPRLIQQEWAKDDELRVRVCSQKFFALWPADSAGKEKRTSSLAVRLNKCLLLPLVGRAEEVPCILNVGELQPLLEHLAASWSVACPILQK